MGRLTDMQWGRVKHLFVEERPEQKKTGRHSSREVLDGVLWVTMQGERWRDLPAEFPPMQICYSSWLAWRRCGVWMRIVECLGPEVFVFRAGHMARARAAHSGLRHAYCRHRA